MIDLIFNNSRGRSTVCMLTKYASIQFKAPETAKYVLRLNLMLTLSEDTSIDPVFILIKNTRFILFFLALFTCCVAKPAHSLKPLS